MLLLLDAYQVVELEPELPEKAIPGYGLKLGICWLEVDERFDQLQELVFRPRVRNIKDCNRLHGDVNGHGHGV